MGMLKKMTEYIPCQHPKYRLRGAHPDWEMHPSWIAGIEALDSYNHWVSEVVLPIAFQWIEEHKADVYASVAQENKDDVGVVIAAAFQLVKELPAYQKGLAASQAYETALADGTWDPSGINPVWTGIAQEVRKATEDSFGEQGSVLKDTIR
jgi:hypothetical protein